MLRRQKPREERGPAGRAKRVRTKGIVESDALRRNSIEVGGVNLAIPIAAKGAGLLIVAENQDDVGQIVIHEFASSPRVVAQYPISGAVGDHHRRGVGVA